MCCRASRRQRMRSKRCGKTFTPQASASPCQQDAGSTLAKPNYAQPAGLVLPPRQSPYIEEDKPGEPGADSKTTCQATAMLSSDFEAPSIQSTG